MRRSAHDIFHAYAPAIDDMLDAAEASLTSEPLPSGHRRAAGLMPTAGTKLAYLYYIFKVPPALSG